jgi:nucleotide-binding universal stress UspA family protein
MNQRRDEKASLESDTERNVRISNGLFAKILVAVDGSRNAHRAAKVAVKFSMRNGAELFVVSVIPRPSYLFAPVSGAVVPPMGLGDYYTYATKDAVKWVDEVISLAKSGGVVARGRVLRSASIVQSITDYAEDEEVDLIVLGTRGMGGFNRLLLGSVSNGVVIHAHCAVLVVR